MTWIKTFLSESDGTGSSMRLVFISGSWWLMIVISILLFRKDVTSTEATIMFTSIFSVLGGGKLIQKSQENKPDLSNPNQPAQ